jgi:cation transport ATPase
MSWFTELFAAPIDKIVTSVGEAIDRNITTDHERLKLANELEQIKANAKLEAAKLEQQLELRLEEEVTKRWQADSQSDEPLAKKVRPLSLIYLLLVVTIMAFADGNALTFEIKTAYIDLFQALLMLVFGAYYGSRGLEKIYAIKSKRS